MKLSGTIHVKGLGSVPVNPKTAARIAGIISQARMSHKPAGPGAQTAGERNGGHLGPILQVPTAPWCVLETY